MASQARKTSVFLDTNSLHYLGQYLQYANRPNNKLFPYGSSSDEKSEVERSIKALSEVQDPILKQSLKRGLYIIEYLKNTKLDVACSIFSEMELRSGRAKGKIMTKFAKEGVPDRMWANIEEGDVRDNLSTRSYNDISRRIGNLMGDIEEIVHNFNVETPDRRILGWTRDISGFIYMSPIDCALYASALDVEADYIITYDTYFRQTINKIHGGDGKYEEIHKRIVSLVEGAMARKTPPGGASFKPPRAFSINADGTKRWK